MTPSHTPGPWLVGPRYGRVSIEVQGPHRAVCHVPAFDHNECTAAGIPTGRGEVANPEGFANARLIAAAPDLLAALEAIRDIREPVNGRDAAEMVCWMRATAREALARARGVEGGAK